MFVSFSSVSAGWEQGINIQHNTSINIKKEQNQNPDKVFTEEVLRLVNIERERLGLVTLKTTTTYNNKANTRAFETSVYFAHRRPNGTSCSTIYSDNNLYYYAAGENIAYGFQTPEALVKAWMNSSSHKANILNNKFIYAGVGYYYGNDGLIYNSLLLCKPKITDDFPI